MRYVIADIHGCYEEYKKLVDKLKLSEDDQLYILGDALDRGPEPIKVLQDIMSRKNVSYIIGNHDYMFLYFMGKLGVDMSKASELTGEDAIELKLYLEDGGSTTIEQYIQLSESNKEAVYEYLMNADVYDVLQEKEKKYILVHAGIANFDESISLEEYDFLDFICERTDYSKRLFQDKNIYVITGHTPTMYIRNDSRPQVFQENGHIGIDCGCVYGGRLAAYCIETEEIIYVNAMTNYME